jgi:hypothetical protein
MAYVSLLYLDLISSKQLLPSGKLPPVAPIVLYNGDTPWRSVTEVSDLVENFPGKLNRFCPKISYLLIDEGRFSDEELSQQSPNLAAELFRLENGKGTAILPKIVGPLMKTLSAPEHAGLRRAFAVFINRGYFKNQVDISDILDNVENIEEVGAMLATRMDKYYQELERNAEAKGIAKGKAEGELKKARATAARMLKSGMPLAQIMHFTELPEDEIVKLIDVANRSEH